MNFASAFTYRNNCIPSDNKYFSSDCLFVPTDGQILKLHLESCLLYNWKISLDLQYGDCTDYASLNPPTGGIM